MDAPSATPTDRAAARLLAVQMLSPAFPTGGFAYAQGLEWAMSQGVVADGAALAEWLRDLLAHGALWSDAVLLSLALRRDADPAALDDLARALCPSPERLTETLEQGTAFARTAAALSGAPALPAALPATLPVAVGRALGPLPLPPAEVIALFLHGQALNLVLAAVRFMPLGQTQGQAVLARLAPDIMRAADSAALATDADLGGCAIGADIAQMRHETMQTRIFRS